MKLFAKEKINDIFDIFSMFQLRRELEYLCTYRYMQIYINLFIIRVENITKLNIYIYIIINVLNILLFI